MISIQGKQLIYCPVEIGYSPNHFSGYQTVYKSIGLQQNEVVEIETQVINFRPLDLQQVRKQYNILSSGNVVLTNTVSIESDPIIVDKYQRPGTFLAHCLIFSPEEFQKVFYNPFKIFDHFAFLKSAGQLSRDYDQENNREPSCVIEVDPYSPTHGGEAWWRDAINIYSLTQQIQKTKFRTNQLVGSDADIEAFLRAVFEFAPLNVRLLCTFDTLSDKRSSASWKYWAIHTFSENNRDQNTINLEQGTIPIINPKTNNDLYAYWLRYAIENLQEKTYLNAISIQAICEAFRNRSRIDQNITIGVSLEFYNANAHFICANLFSLFSDVSSKSIAGKLLKYIETFDVAYINPRDLLSIASSNLIYVQELILLIRGLIESNLSIVTELSRSDWKIIEHYATQINDNVLLLWAAIWLKNKTLRQRILSEISANEYQDSILLMPSPLSPNEFVSSKHISIFVDKIKPLLTEISDKQFIEIVNAILTSGCRDYLCNMIDRIGSMERKNLIELIKLCNKRADIPPLFTKAVFERYKQFPLH
jgi:hypothetical protein